LVWVKDLDFGEKERKKESWFELFNVVVGIYKGFVCNAGNGYLDYVWKLAIGVFGNFSGPSNV
jgi:hypothetical protein